MRCASLRPICPLARCALLAAVGLLAALPAARACQTPVYRYAMYKWTAAPYEAYYLYRGQPAAEDLTILGQMKQAADKQTGPRANLIATAVDVDDRAALARLPRRLAELVAGRGPQEYPVWHLQTPHGQSLYDGSLTPGDFAALVDSPARKTVNELLAAGSPCVFILVKGKDDAANQRAIDLAGRIIAKAVAGDYTPKVDDAAVLSNVSQSLVDKTTLAQERDDDATTAEPDAVTPALVAIDRDDPAERWLVRMLMLTEGDLEDYRDEPMMFMVYGRGRAKMSCLGRGIDERNLTFDLSVALGECSCEIKEQNPGLDLLTTHDWDAAAAAMAEHYGNETGNEQLVSEDDFYRLLASGGVGTFGGDGAGAGVDDRQADPSTTGDTAANGTAPPDATGIAPRAEKDPLEKDASPAAEKAAGTQSSATARKVARRTSLPAASPASPAEEDAGLVFLQQLGNAGIALGAMVAALLVVAVLFLRPRSTAP